MFSVTFNHMLITPLPTCRLSTVLNILHSHESLILLNPLVISHHLISNSDSPTAAKSSDTTTEEVESSSSHETYVITDSVPMFFGLLSNTVEYKATFENTDRGVNTVVVAPMGILSIASWTAGQRISDTGGVVVEVVEEVEVRCNRLLMPFVRWTMGSAHQELHRRLVELVQEREDGVGMKDERWGH